MSPAPRMDAVFGYVGFNDVSARGLGRSGINSFLGKSFDTFAAFGPWIVTKDDIPDPQSLSITVDVNGERRQDYSTSDMERPIRELLTYISSVTTLHPGDVICCGTNHQGSGSMQDGDEVVTTVSGIGSFSIHVEDEHQRAWQRGIDREAAERVKASAQHPGRGGHRRVESMRLVLTADDRIVVQRDGGIVDVSAAFADIRYRTAADRMPRVIAVPCGSHGTESRRSQRAATCIPTGDLQAPVPRPPKLIAAFGNYREGSDRERQAQDMFLESPDSVIGPNGTVVLPNHPATIFHHEAELALVVGRRAKDLPADERALDALAGYTCAIDVSARGMGRVGPSRIGKSFDTFTPLGPAIVTVDEMPDAQNLRVTLSVNGELRQDYSTSDMEYSVLEILAFISSYMTLVPGDVILCGTNHQGLGALQDGDRAEMTIEGIGTLAVSVRDPQRREWPREVDQEMAARQRSVGAG